MTGAVAAAVRVATPAVVVVVVGAVVVKAKETIWSQTHEGLKSGCSDYAISCCNKRNIFSSILKDRKAQELRTGSLDKNCQKHRLSTKKDIFIIGTKKKSLLLMKASLRKVCKWAVSRFQGDTFIVDTVFLGLHYFGLRQYFFGRKFQGVWKMMRSCCWVLVG